MQLKLIKHKWKIILCLLFIFISTCALAACTYKFDPVEEGYTVTVIYDANGGRYNSSDKTGLRTFRYLPSASIMQPGGTQNQEFEAPKMDSYHVINWYKASLDTEGNPLKDDDGLFVDEEGNSIFDGTPWDFSKDRLPAEDGSVVYLVADWAMNYFFTIDVGEEARDEGVENIVRSDYVEPGPVSAPGLPPKWTGHTVYYYYYLDEAGQKVRLYNDADWSKLVLSDENPKIVVYVEWLEGNWVIVTTADQLKEANSYTNYLLEADIDMNGDSFSLEGYSGEFDGNGHTISNMTIENNGMTSGFSFGAFSFSGTGYMHDVVFKNLSYSITVRRRLPNIDSYYSIGIFNGSGYKTDGYSPLDLEKFTGLAFIDCELEVKRIYEALDNNVSIVTGSGSYFGIFGSLPAGSEFTPAEGSNAVSVTIDEEPVTQA